MIFFATILSDRSFQKCAKAGFWLIFKGNCTHAGPSQSEAWALALESSTSSLTCYQLGLVLLSVGEVVSSSGKSCVWCSPRLPLSSSWIYCDYCISWDCRVDHYPLSIALCYAFCQKKKRKTNTSTIHISLPLFLHYPTGHQDKGSRSWAWSCTRFLPVKCFVLAFTACQGSAPRVSVKQEPVSNGAAK